MVAVRNNKSELNVIDVYHRYGTGRSNVFIQKYNSRNLANSPETSGITDVLGGCLTDLVRKEPKFSVGRRLCNKECCLLPEIKSDLQEEIDELWWVSI